VRNQKLKKDYTGATFGDLTVIGFERFQSEKTNDTVRIWLCECKCGNKICSRIHPIKTGVKKNCGSCLGFRIRKDYANKRFGNITVLNFEKYYIDEKGKKKDSFWLCQCDCGEKFVRRIRLVKGGKNQCCRKCSFKRGNEHHSWKGCGEISKDLFNSYRNSAADRNLEFNVTIEYMWSLFLKQNRKCALTGWEIHFPPTYREKTKKTASPDRIDSKKGYVKGNIQWIHQDVNYLKSNWDPLYFVEICTAVATEARKKGNRIKQK
jgi:hypothetical protein